MKHPVLRATALVALVLLSACGSDDPNETVAVSIEHSRFELDRHEFETGETVTFVIENTDPIDHEFILGDERVQARHEEGRERHHHGDIPGEVSVPAGTTRTTTFTFTDEGELTYACHLPRHFDYGMAGALSVS